MIGYIRPWEPELKIREFRYYRGVYCGLCHSMGKCTGQCSRLTLSYDLVFYALVRLALENGNPTTDGTDRPVNFVRRRCLLHPFRSRPVLEHGRVLEDVACASAILQAYQLADDAQDEHGTKRWRACLLAPISGVFHRRAASLRQEMDETVASDMAAFSCCEKELPPSADRPADGFGRVMGNLFASGYEENRAHIAFHIGFHVGRWLYLLDAADDYGEDCRDGRFNALRGIYGEGAALDQTRRQDLLLALSEELRQSADALDLWEWDDSRCGVELRAILYHMLTVALPRKTKEVLFPSEFAGRIRKGRKDHTAVSAASVPITITDDTNDQGRTGNENDRKEREYKHDGSI